MSSGCSLGAYFVVNEQPRLEISCYCGYGSHGWVVVMQVVLSSWAQSNWGGPVEIVLFNGFARNTRHNSMDDAPSTLPTCFGAIWPLTGLRCLGLQSISPDSADLPVTLRSGKLHGMRGSRARHHAASPMECRALGGSRLIGNPTRWLGHTRALVTSFQLASLGGSGGTYVGSGHWSPIAPFISTNQ